MSETKKSDSNITKTDLRDTSLWMTVISDDYEREDVSNIDKDEDEENEYNEIANEEFASDYEENEYNKIANDKLETFSETHEMMTISTQP